MNISSVRNEIAIEAAFIHYTNSLPEYPETHPYGVAYIVEVKGLNKEEIDMICNTVNLLI